MKKKLIFILMVVLALVLTTGTFAYTYTNQNATSLQGTLADDAFTTYQVAAHQPNWESILPTAQLNMEMLYPVAAGDSTEFRTQYPDFGEHFDKVADISAADMDTYISTQGSNHASTDLFKLSPFNGMGGLAKIGDVTIYYRAAAGGDYDVAVMGALETNGQIYQSPGKTIHGTDFVTNTWVCTVNPSTGKAWTWLDINSLQAGITGVGNSRYNPLICTYVYVVVNYKYTLIEGAVPLGNLYDITPHPGYTGDLLVKIYLTNTADILKAYKYLNMKVTMTHSLEADKTPNYQVLSIENGVVIFNIQGGAAASYTVSISGGAYRIMSDQPDEWSPGWSITPEFYCEVTQR
jgi:hypothetical protein